ncbi:MAG: PDZ domain-containing protein, partial [Planctomycetes bacterium]|nr:PDZ domain-containing protein [Planctomycetota bacterium]
MFSSSRLRTSVYLVSGVILALTAVSWATSDDLLRGGKATARAEGEGQLSDDGFGGGDVPFIRMGDWRAADGGSPDLPFAFVQGKNVGVMVTTDSDGNFTAKVNGEEVDESRIRRNGDDVDVLDEDGSVLLHFRMPTQGKIEFPFGGRTWFPPRQEEPVRRAAIGIRMETASDALAYHLDLQDPAVMVTDVVEGLPAADAGVQRFDVITSVDGKSGVTLESLRDAVASHQEGETIRFEIVRRGQRHTVDVPVVMREMPSTARWVEDNFPVRP